MKKTKKIPIKKMYDTIIIEKSDGNKILKGSHLFCGCCGGSMGTMKKEMTLPFQLNVFMKQVKDISFTVPPGPLFAIRHTCKHNMFVFRGSVGFSKLEDHMKELNTN